MNLALQLAKKAKGWTLSNPLVGAVIVNDDRLLAEGYHKAYGRDHAEVDAINNALDSVEGATLYVNLEPCCHEGKQPPCVEAIINSGIKRVVVGMLDPNPKVSGKGVERLKKSGIEVITGVLEDEAKLLNEEFIKFITTGLPFVTAKSAITLDGKVATRTGDSQWITSEESRKDVHRLRHENMAIMVGIGTVLADDPLLNTRIEGLKSPIRVVIDSNLRIPEDSRMFHLDENETIIFTTEAVPKAKVEILNSKPGISVVIADTDKSGSVNLNTVLKILGERGISSILVEGGALILGALSNEKLVDKYHIYIAPKFIGDHEAPSFINGESVEHINDAQELINVSYKVMGADILVTGYPRRS
ncbi:MAG: bifunctional diaminohydroxyphosphoribosylaminopyrimidine deaminase/5-amino-6-(5-phosphoribosylamino)uracil reductase RibD [Tissierellia bacterium]|nr:bifunctional diaminohydroxyphosphoribosylaminopyrimidine deaminase/5-amino-6-(5-phosphoribosylamino)uracil reductase RibD [Tissierellia bacterium]